jgi:hypothetical protein
MPARNKKNFRSTKSGAGMTRAGVKAYRRMNPGSKLKTAVTGKVKPGSKAAKRRKSYCARSAGQMKKFPKAARDPNSRLRQARRRWKPLPRDTVSIKFATPLDAKKTVAKVKKISKPFARKIQILTVGEQRAKVMGKSKVAAIFKKGKESIRNAKSNTKRAKS